MTSFKSKMKGLIISSTLRKSLLNTSTAMAIALASATTFAIQAEAQVTTSAVKGTVIAGGAPVANATVVVTHTPSGSKKTLTTNNNGGYSVSGLRVGGPYTISVTSDKGNNTVEDVYLTLGGVFTIPVSVSADTGALEEIVVTGSSLSGGIQMGAGSAIDQRTMDGIPATGRDFADYVKINPMVNLDPTDNLVGISVAGTNNRFNSITIDGVAQNDDFGLNANGQPGQRNTISMDVVEQIAINIAPFDVQYNGFQGANFNVVTKSGTNEFHGTAYGFLRNDSLSGSSSRDGDGDTNENLISEFSEKTWGATLGGPIIKDKLFFMVGYEEFSSSTPITTGPEGSSFGNIVEGVTQADLDRAADIAQDVYGFDAGRFGDFESLDEKDRKIFAKLDWNINEDHRASLTYQNTKGNKIFIRNTSANFGDISLPSAWYDKIEKIETYSLQVFSDWSENFSTELKVSKKDQVTRQDSLFGADFASVEIDVGSASIFLGPDLFRHANFLENNAWGAKFKATYLSGDHEISAGIEYDVFDVFNLFIPGSEGIYEFDGLDNFEARIADDFSYTNAFTNVEDDGGAEFSTKQLTLYLQDTWTVNEKLSMQFGARFERFSTGDKPALNQNFLNNYGFGNDETLDGKNIFLPRFGFNYAYDERTTIRGGAGLFSGGSPNVWISNNYTNDGQTIVRADLDGLDPAVYLENVNGFDIPQEVQDTLVQGNGSVNYLSPDFKLPSSWKFNLAIEHDFDLGETFGDGYLVTVEALITTVKNATNWEELRAGTQIGTAPDGRPIYNRQNRGSYDLGLINTTEGGAEVFTVAIQKEYDSGVSFNAAYANTSAREVNPGTSSTATSNFGKVGISDRSNFELATSVFENKHRFTLNLNYVTEFIDDLETRFGIFFETRSGRPFSYTYDQASSSRDIPFGGGAEFERRDRQLVYVPTSGDSAMCYTGCVVGGDDPIDSAVTEADFLAFIQETGLDKYAGSIAPRNSQRNPWYSKLDFRFTQEIPGLMDGHKGLFSFDITNLTNLLNNKWGRFEQTGFPSLERVGRVSITDDNRYVLTRFNGLGNPRLNTLASVWKMRLGVKYSF